MDINSSQLKLGNKLKYIKYVLLKNKPPNPDQVNELLKYLKKFLKADEDIINQVIQNIKELLDYTEQQIEDQCQEWEIEEDEQIKLKIIIELMKKEVVDINNSKQQEELNLEAENGRQLINNIDNEIIITESINLKGEYELYSLIELYDYETSQEDMTSGLINPINEFKKLCEDFKIDFQNEGTYINFNQAFKIKMYSSMLWGTKESIRQFFTDKGINNALTYFEKKERDKKAGIYLCINKKTLYALLIIWPGELNYKYDKIDEPNNNILLTLVRYGFSLDSNSILCFSNELIKDFNSNGYEIFRETESKGFEAERSKIVINVIKEKSFELLQKKEVKLDNDFSNKIYDKKINQNCLLIYQKNENNLPADKKTNNIEDFLKYNSSCDIYFDMRLEYIKPAIFYYIINNNHIYLKEADKEKYFFSKKSLKETFKRKIYKIVEDLLIPLYNYVTQINKSNISNFIKCENYKQKKNNDSQDFYYILKKNDTIKYFHKNCIDKYPNNQEDNEPKLILGKNFEYDENIIIHQQYKEFVDYLNNLINEKKKNYKADILKKYLSNCQQKFKTVSKILDDKIMLEEIEAIKENSNEIYFKNDKKKNELIGEALKFYRSSFYDMEKTKKLSKEWKENWKEKINKYIIEHGIKKYIKIKNIKYNKGNAESLTSWNIVYEYVEESLYIDLYEIKPIKDSSDLTLVFSRKLGQEYSIENYFPSYKKGLIINKDQDKIKIQYNDKIIDEYNGLYDYDRISDTLIVFRREDNNKKLGIYYNVNKSKRESKSKSLLCNEFLSDGSIIHKIMLVPCFPSYEKQSILLFVDKEIHMIQIDNKYEFPKILDLKKEFQYKKFEEFQFLIHIDFILILHFDINMNKWKGKVYSLCLEDDSLFNLLKEIELEESNDKTLFSIAELKESKYLFSLNIIGNKPIIKYREIDSRLSGISTSYQNRSKKKQENSKLALGHCVINYFYHCFDKYPLLGALPYNLKEYYKNEIKLSFYLKDELNDKYHYLKKYIDMLKMHCEGKKKTSFQDMNFNICKDYSKFFTSQNSSLGSLIIQILEVTPIQIAKIMEREFKIMSNGENIEKKLFIESKRRIEHHKEAKFDIQNYSKVINFCMKDSIFNYFEIPVIVICCFGTQSIGKSTFLNELTGSLFDVSGKRCTEGIWMSIKVFFQKYKTKEKISCNNDCINCKKNKCEQIIHSESKICLCNQCLCGKKCFMDQQNPDNEFNNCYKYCCLKKDHEINIKCSFEQCLCNCVCECICTNYEKKHNHICKDCLNNKIEICECDCNCKHFCGLPLMLHNFICVCLDFEGLGTFERTNEQDIQMALVGSAIGNSIIFRTGNTFDLFTENILEKLGLGSYKLKDVSIEQFFGGSLFFSPRDVNPSDKNKLKEEFTQKIEKSIKKWNLSVINLKEEETKIKNNKYTIFGLFEDKVFAPTPNYPDYTFYKTLRENLTKEIIENTLKYDRNPKFKTGKEFYTNIKLFLSAVYMNEYEFLTNHREKIISEYINENIDKAYEICGILKNNDITNNKILFEDNAFKCYIKNDNIEELSLNLFSNKKFEINNLLIISNINISENIQGHFESEKYGIQINVSRSEYNNIIISLEGFNDYGLVLLIFNEIEESFTYESLCSNLFDIWDNICKTIGLNDKTTINYFGLFIKAIIDRRTKNVQNWLDEMTKDEDNLKALRIQYSLINNIWVLCRQQCKYCYYSCFLIQGHKDEHKCPYNHKCKEICSLCIKSQCSDKNCEHNCLDKAGHPSHHTCDHVHQCRELCYLNNCTIDCKGRCILQLGHENNHICELENHHCNLNCELYSKARNCKGKCILSYPHEGKEHDCGGDHYCMGECCLKENSQGCKFICYLEYGHEGNHYCGENHICNQNCYLLGKARNCNKKCNLTFPHEGTMHYCGEDHYCSNECSFVNEASGCINNKICNLKYDHKGSHNCCGQHYCNSECSLINEALNCGGKCVLEYPHEENHMCSREHLCKKKCQFDGMSKTCGKNCILKYKHVEACICSYIKEQHICNKKCYNCNKDCILLAGHESQCICGECTCPEKCKYIDCSRGCQKKCQFKIGHEGEHICNSKHFCKNKCPLKSISKNCDEYCSFEIKDSIEHSNHICKISIEKHGCNGICCHFDNSRNCKKNCSREVNHSGNHFCDINIDQHLCKKTCYLLEFSQKCNKICNLPFNHNGNHICSIGSNNHICNKKCSLSSYSREGCAGNCCLASNHSGQCICSNQWKMHICNKQCDLFDKSEGCKKLCNLPPAHEGEHQCGVSRLDHICKGICTLKGKTRGKCYDSCCLPYGHNGDCICKTKNIGHICNKECSLFNKANGCNRYCNKLYGHSDQHFCESSKHICPNKCYYFGKCKGKCDQFCKLEYGHNYKCSCTTENLGNYHLCNKNCSYYKESRGCNKECSKIYGHNDMCQCNVKNEFHFCKRKCELCENTECGHVFNHQKSNSNIKCCKCKDSICILTGNKQHICGSQHNCKEECQEKGWCQIISYVQVEQNLYESITGEWIKYEAKKSQDLKKNKCIIKIEENEFDHENGHKCGEGAHKCGYQCLQCEHHCTEDKGHKGLHNCFHGNIKNSCITISDQGGIAKIKKDHNEYTFQEGELAIIFFCDEYCKEQGQGHLHQFISKDNINNENVKLINRKMEFYGNRFEYIYECKCSYFWENILQFKHNFTTEEKNKFNLCNWKCKYPSHQTPEYCQLPLWHEKTSIIPYGVYGKWIYEGHVLKCIHPIAIYSIFLIDRSGSMYNGSEKPTNMKIKEKLDNKLGASIQALEGFCKLRNSKNFKDKCSLIGFNDSAEIILRDIYMDQNESMINICLSKLNPGGGTSFYGAFNESKILLEEIDRNEFIPIIILLTDGLDNYYEETKPLVEEVRKYFNIYLYR